MNRRAGASRRPITRAAVIGATAGIVVTAIFAVVNGSSAAQYDVGRQVLRAHDGFASLGDGVIGGAAADDQHVFVVSNRLGLVAALNAGPAGAPRIIYISGVIDANVDDANRPLACEDYYRDGYTRTAFLDFYNPVGPWGPNPPANTTGSLEAARRTSAAAQSARIRMRIPDSTTLVGADRNSTIRGAWFDLRGTAAVPRRNIIIRDLTFEDVVDCFPAWTPTRRSDGSWAGTGAWDSEYDAISLRDTDHVWIDHNDFRDRTTGDNTLPTLFGAKYQMHDGLVDITNASDLVTVSWNRFVNHDKTMLVGSSDDAPADVGRLRVTLHHNQFENVGQRAPRVRYGQVHVYNNYYVIPDGAQHGYSWGVGFQPVPVQSGIYAEGNFFRTEKSVTPDQLIATFAGGRGIFVKWTMQSAGEELRDIDPRSAYNTAFDPDVAGDVGWTPTVYLGLDPTHRVPAFVELHAGPYKW